MSYFINPAVVYGFTATLLHSRFDNPKPTPQFHKELWNLMCDDHPFAAAAAPRSHAKSTAVTHSFSLACICFKLKSHILIVSNTEAQAINFLNDIKTEFYENEDLIKTFGFKRFIKDAQTEVVGEFEDGSKFRVVAKGSEQKIRGIKWRNKRPDLIMIDDAEDDEIVMNEERRHKFRSWFRNALLPCGSDTCHYRMVGTILHMDSVLESLMPPKAPADKGDNYHDSTVLYKLKEVNLDRRRQWISIRFRAHPSMYDFSEILWPEQFSERRLTQIRQGYIDDGMPDGYAQEYLNNPLDETNAMFVRTDFQSLGDDCPLDYYISADLAISEKKARAYSVFAVAGVTPDGILRYENVVRIRGDAYVLVDTLFELVSIYEPEMVIIEKENIATTLHGMILREMQDRDIYFRLEMPTPTKDKVARARPLQLRMRAGRVEFDTSAPWFASFQEECLQFPRGKYKDQVDAASWIPYMIQHIASAPTAEQLAEEEWEEEYETSYASFEMGASKVTGY